MPTLNINTVRCEALFTHALLQSRCSTVDEVHVAIMLMVREFGSRGCAAWVAQEFGDHPETAVPRMSWARARIAEIFDGGATTEASTMDTAANSWSAGTADRRAS